jgi:hypothetical protein
MYVQLQQKRKIELKRKKLSHRNSAPSDVDEESSPLRDSVPGAGKVRCGGRSGQLAAAVGRWRLLNLFPALSLVSLLFFFSWV